MKPLGLTDEHARLSDVALTAVPSSKMASVGGRERAYVNSAPLSHNNRNDCVCVATLAAYVRVRLIYTHPITPLPFFF